MPPLLTRIDGPVTVIGDVHGQLRECQAVVEQLQSRPDFSDRWIVFIGDLIDRGPDSRGVVELVCELRNHHPRTTVVAGNHEYVLALAMGWIPHADQAELQLEWAAKYGAEETFESYGVPPGDFAALADAMPDSHRDLLANLPWCVEHPKYLFVHAGLDPNMPYAVQQRILTQKDLSLSHPPWLCSHGFVKAEPPADCPKAVVSGHVRVPQAEVRKRRVLVDTTGGRGGDLSAVLLPEGKVITSAAEPVGAGAPWWRFW